MKRQEAFEATTEALRNAQIDVNDATNRDRAAGMVLTVMRAASEGATREKLRLLARAAAGLLREGTPSAEDELQYWKTTLDRLTVLDLRFIGALHKHWHQNLVDDPVKAAVKAYSETKGELLSAGISEEEIEIMAETLLSSGLVRGQKTVGGGDYYTTGRVDRLLRLADLEKWAATQLGSPP